MRTLKILAAFMLLLITTFASWANVATLSNSVAGNTVRVFDDHLMPVGEYPTGGVGTGVFLGSQWALAASQGMIFGVNPGDNTWFSLKPTGNGKRATPTVIPSGGMMPISIAVSDDTKRVLVLNSDGTLASFKKMRGTGFVQVASATLGVGSNPAEVAMSPDGDFAVVTLKGTSQIAVFPLGKDGSLGTPTMTASDGAVPYGFDFWQAGGRTYVDVSQASGATSSYQLMDDGTLPIVTGSLSDGQGAPCWAFALHGEGIVISNAASGSLSLFPQDRRGNLSIESAPLVLTGDATHPLDLGGPKSGRFLFVHAKGAAGTPDALIRINPTNNGGLMQTAFSASVPAGSVGVVYLPGDDD